MFSHQKDGYNQKEVETKINSLLSELTNLRRAMEEKDKLNIGLANALRKSKEIEASSQNLYDLKIQKLLILYKNLAKSFNTLFTLYPQIEELDDIKKSFDKFSEAAISTLRIEDNKTINDTVNTDNDTIRLLLNKMSAYPATESPAPKRTASIKRKDSRPTPKDAQISKVLHVDENADGYECPADKFLESGETENNAYAKILSHEGDFTPNESGFDLKEAVNPKDDLSEIMKAFDLD
ncbi:MAG: hypothetical protein ACLRFR_04345 [Clostridia bacterium]